MEPPSLASTMMAAVSATVSTNRSRRIRECALERSTDGLRLQRRNFASQAVMPECHDCAMNWMLMAYQQQLRATICASRIAEDMLDCDRVLLNCSYLRLERQAVDFAFRAVML
jgi:hypothetical protein